MPMEHNTHNNVITIHKEITYTQNDRKRGKNAGADTHERIKNELRME